MVNFEQLPCESFPREVRDNAANELVTEKKPEKRAYWLPFVERQFGRAAVLVFFVGVLNLLTPTPAEAAPMLDVGGKILCIMLNIAAMAALEQAQLFRTMKMFIESLFAPLTVRTTHP